MKVLCKYNNSLRALPTNCPKDFNDGLQLNKLYLVMGIALYRGANNLYYLVDEDGRPSWFPHQLFEIIDDSLSLNWHIKIIDAEQSSDIYSIWGFSELCRLPDYYDRLVDRDDDALHIYFKRKIELEQEDEERKWLLGL